jgi:hypothetical protein
MLNRPQEILFVTNEGRVQKDGYSLRLGKGQFGIVDKGAAKTAAGERVTTTLPQDNDRLFELVLGSSDLNVNRSQSNAGWRSIPFKLSDVVDIKVKKPQGKGTVDEVLIGYDGINADTALVFQNGDNEVLDITLRGEAIGMLGYPNSEVTVKLYLEAPNGEVAFTNHEIVEKGVERLLKTTLIGGVPITQYLEITPVNSAQGALSGTDYSFFRLTVSDDGRESDKALVQAQYPTYKVEREDYRNGVSTYVILALANASIANYSIPADNVGIVGCENCPSGYTATDAGVVYKVILNDEGTDVIETIIDTLPGFASAEKVGNENGIGTYIAVVDNALTAGEITTFITANPTASVELVGEISVLCDNNASAQSIAWVKGETGTAVEEVYEIQLGDNECGQSRLTELQATYPSLTIAVKGTSSRAITLTGTSGTANIAVAGTNYLATFASDLTTTAANFVTAHAAAILTATGATVTAAAGVITITDSNFRYPTITITNASGNLAGTVGALTAVTTVEGACQTVYTTTVLSNPVFDECDDILLGLYFTDAPSPFETIHWKKAAKTYNANALMGIRIKTKMMILVGDTEEYRFEMPDVYDPIRISVSSETGMVNESFRSGELGRFAVKLLSVASRPDNLGLDFRDLEHRSFVYYNGNPIHKENFARLILGEESLLKPLAQYVQYQVKVRTTKISGMFATESVNNHNYVILAELGKHEDVQDVVNALAIAAGKNPVYV